MTALLASTVRNTHFGIGTVLGLVLLTSIVVGIWAFIDAAMKPRQAFNAVGVSKARWMVGIAVTVLVLGPIGGAIALYYLAIIRPKVDAR